VHAKLEVLKRLGILVQADRPLAETTESTVPRGEKHLLSTHTPAWEYLPPELARPYDASVSTRPLFATPEPSATLASLLEITGFFVLIGAAATEEFATLEKTLNAVKLVFEPDPQVFESFLQGRETRNLARERIFFFVGDPAAWPASLFALLPPALCEFGFPVFLVQEGLAECSPDYLAVLIETLEIYYFRHRIYAIEGQANRRGMPLRELKRGLFFDQIKHLYENICAHATAGAMDDLRDRCKGATALCVAAGPDLDRKIEYLKQNRGKTILICVNNALRVLLKHGLVPHFTVINDTSLDAGKAFEGLPPGLDTRLVCHSLAHAGAGSFAHTYFFGDFMPHLLGQRGNLRLHGSVITTAFSLALLLGCTRCVLVGVQLGSTHPYTFAYSRDTRYGNGGGESEAQNPPPLLTHKFPQLYPCRGANGRPLYSTLNFRDASLWFLEYIREAQARGVEVVNTTDETLIYGPGIRIDAEYAVTAPVDSDALVAALPCQPPAMSSEQVLSFLGGERAMWSSIYREAVALVAALGRADDAARTERTLARAAERIAYFDANTVSYLVQRFADFDNSRFHELFFGSEAKINRLQGAFYYFSYLRDLAHVLESLLAVQRNQWEQLQR